MTPKQLDEQSPVKIDRWVDVDSEESKEMDDTRAFTKKCILMGFATEINGKEGPIKVKPFMYLDNFGRVWCHDPDNESKPHYPFHSDGPRGELIGYKISKKAAN